MRFASIVLSFAFFTTQLHAKVLQEGWFKILSGQQHVGYAVQRYAFDESKKQFRFVSFIKTNALGGNVTDSVVEACTDGFNPVSYQYTTQIDKKIKLIDAVFKGDNMIAKITEDKQVNSVENKLKKGVFLSNFLVYMILNNKAGLKPGNSFEYEAIAEEDAQVVKGFADIKNMETIDGHEVFKVLNKFKDIQSISHVSPIGEILDVKQPVSGIQMISSKREDATKGFPSSEKLLKTLFGKLPKDSPLATASVVQAASPAKTENVKEAEKNQPNNTLPKKEQVQE